MYVKLQRIYTNHPIAGNFREVFNLVSLREIAKFKLILRYCVMRMWLVSVVAKFVMLKQLMVNGGSSEVHSQRDEQLHQR